MITWWQSLLISTAPAIVTGFLSWVFSKNDSKKELVKLKEELKVKSQSEQKLYISKTRFDMEFVIYKEVSEKIVSLVIAVNNLFPSENDYAPQDKKLREKYNKEIYNLVSANLDDANRTINRYAVFIPECWFKMFIDIKNLCYLQAKWFFDLKILKNDSNGELTNCFKRTDEINNKYELLIKELREYIEKIDVKESK